MSNWKILFSFIFSFLSIFHKNDWVSFHLYNVSITISKFFGADVFHCWWILRNFYSLCLIIIKKVRHTFIYSLRWWFTINVLIWKTKRTTLLICLLLCFNLFSRNHLRIFSQLFIFIFKHIIKLFSNFCIYYLISIGRSYPFTSWSLIW